MTPYPRWQAVPPPDPAATQRLAQALGLDSVTAGVLVGRGIGTYDQARSYFAPAWADLPDPFLLLGMAAASERLAQALERQETVVIYGDYDVDGTTAVALVAHFLSRHRTPHETYVPDRATEGYGLSAAGVEFAQSIGAHLLVVLDCGTRDLAAVAQARAAGIDVVICDHHEPGPNLPEAVALLNPKQPGCPYPFKDLCACGVALKLVQATATRLNLAYDAAEVLDLVALAIACDIVPMHGENRTLAHLGLDRLINHPSRGLAALMRQSDKARRWQISDLVFFLGPRINAAGRIGHASAAVELLLGRVPDIDALAADLEALNTERKALEQATTLEALAQAESLPQTHGLVLAGAGWHKGVVGIVAAKVVERYHRPTVVLTLGPEGWVGSARSVPGFDLYQALEACSPYLGRWGGHRHAAGLQVPADGLVAFRAAFEEVCQANLQPEQRQPVQLIDAPLALRDVTTKFARLHQRMEPFGPGNRRPVFVAYDVAPERLRILKDEHLQLELRQDHTVLPAVGFGLAPRLAALPKGEPLAVAFYPEIHHWNGRSTLRLYLKDLKTSAQATQELLGGQG